MTIDKTTLCALGSPGPERIPVSACVLPEPYWNRRTNWVDKILCVLFLAALLFCLVVWAGSMLMAWMAGGQAWQTASSKFWDMAFVVGGFVAQMIGVLLLFGLVIYLLCLLLDWLDGATPTPTEPTGKVAKCYWRALEKEEDAAFDEAATLPTMEPMGNPDDVAFLYDATPTLAMRYSTRIWGAMDGLFPNFPENELAALLGLIRHVGHCGLSGGARMAMELEADTLEWLASVLPKYPRESRDGIQRVLSAYWMENDKAGPFATPPDVTRDCPVAGPEWEAARADEEVLVALRRLMVEAFARLKAVEDGEVPADKPPAYGAFVLQDRATGCELRVGGAEEGRGASGQDDTPSGDCPANRLS